MLDGAALPSIVRIPTDTLRNPRFKYGFSATLLSMPDTSPLTQVKSVLNLLRLPFILFLLFSSHLFFVFLSLFPFAFFSSLMFLTFSFFLFVFLHLLDHIHLMSISFFHITLSSFSQHSFILPLPILSNFTLFIP